MRKAGVFLDRATNVLGPMCFMVGAGLFVHNGSTGADDSEAAKAYRTLVASGLFLTGATIAVVKALRDACGSRPSVLPTTVFQHPIEPTEATPLLHGNGLNHQDTAVTVQETDAPTA